MEGKKIAEAVFDGCPTPIVLIGVEKGEVLNINTEARGLLGKNYNDEARFNDLFSNDADFPIDCFLDDLRNKNRASAIVKCGTGHLYLDGSVINTENGPIGYITLKLIAVADEIEGSKTDILTGIFRTVLDLPGCRNEREIIEKAAQSLYDVNWNVVKIGLFNRDFGLTHRYIVGLSGEEEERYSSSEMTPGDRARFFGDMFDEFKVGRSYFFPEEKGTGRLNSYGHRPGKRAPLSDDTWKPLDVYRVPIYDDSANVTGAIDPDDPRNGKRPDPETILLLDLFAESIAKSLDVVRSRIDEPK